MANKDMEQNDFLGNENQDENDFTYTEDYGDMGLMEDDGQDEQAPASNGVDQATLDEINALFSTKESPEKNNSEDLSLKSEVENNENKDEALEEFQKNVEQAKKDSESNDNKQEPAPSLKEEVKEQAAAPSKRTVPKPSFRMPKNNDDKEPIQSGPYQTPTIVDYQRYLIAVKELSLPENDKSFNAFVGILAGKMGLDPETATAEDLTRIDSKFAQQNLDLLTEVAPDVVESSNRKIQEDYDAWEIMTDAGIDIANSEIPMDFMNDVQVMAAFDDQFPDESRVPLKQRIADMKDDLIAVVKSDNVQLGLATLSFGLAVSAGAVTLPVAGLLYTAKLMENEKVQDFSNTVQRKLSTALVKAGFKEEAVEGREVLIGDKLKAISDSKWGKVAKFGLAAGLIGFSAHSIIQATDFSFDKIPDYYASTKEAVINVSGKAGNYLSRVFSGDVIPGQETYETVKNMIQQRVENGEMPGQETWSDVKSALATSTDPVLQDYVVSKNDNAWNMAKEHYVSVTGSEPTSQQIVAMVNDLDLEDPNNIKIGDILKFNTDVSKYDDVTSIKTSDADWLKDVDQGADVDQNANTGQSADVEPAATNLEPSTDFGNKYDINVIAAGADRAKLELLNENIDLDNLMPGDSVKVPSPSGDVYTYDVPHVEDAIIDTVFPDGVPEFIDRNRFFDMVVAANPDINLDAGVLDYFNDDDFGSQMAKHADFNIPDISPESLAPQNIGTVQINGIGGIGGMEREILKAAYPNGIPDLLDRHAFIDAIKEANPDANFSTQRDYFDAEITIPDVVNGAESTASSTELPEAGEAASGTPSESAKKDFLDRIMSKNAEFSI